MSFGYCTYWVATKRGGIGWLGNAAQWPAGARAAGYKMGKTPVAGSSFYGDLHWTREAPWNL
jgi:surface antigen